MKILSHYFRTMLSISLCAVLMVIFEVQGVHIYKRELKLFDHRVKDDVEYLEYLCANLYSRTQINYMFRIPEVYQKVKTVEYYTWKLLFEDMTYFDTGVIWSRLYYCVTTPSKRLVTILGECVADVLPKKRKIPKYEKVVMKKMESDGSSVIQRKLQRLQLEIEIISVVDVILLNMRTDFVWEQQLSAVFDLHKLRKEVQSLVCCRPKLLKEADELYCSEFTRKPDVQSSTIKDSGIKKSRTKIVKKKVRRTYQDRWKDIISDYVYELVRLVIIVTLAIFCFLTSWILLSAFVTGRELRHVWILLYHDVMSFLSTLSFIFTSSGTPIGNAAVLLARRKYPQFDIGIFRETNSRRTVLLGYDKSMAPNKTKELNQLWYKLLIRNPSNISDEALRFRPRFQNSASKFSVRETILIRHCIKANSKTLWAFHSNLMVLTADHEKIQQGVKHNKICIVFYCLSKGYIPINEKPFPKVLKCRLGELETDVREGYFVLGGLKVKTTKRRGDLDGFNDPLCMGSNIGEKDRGLSGTLGLFVNLPQKEKGFITCCHVLFECIGPNRFLYKRVHEKKSTYHHVIQPGNSAFCGRDDKLCGVVERAVFIPNISPVSVDAALVKVTERKPNNGHFVIRSIAQVNEIGYKKDAYPQFNNGTIQRYIDEAQLELPVLKSGTTTGLTRSFLRLDCTEVRIFNEGVILGMKDAQPIVMKGQYEIDPGSIYNPFFIPGDSGSAVFLKEPNGRLVCIGMAIGKTSYETTVVTPIGPVLDSLGLSDDSVSTF